MKKRVLSVVMAGLCFGSAYANTTVDYNETFQGNLTNSKYNAILKAFQESESRQAILVDALKNLRFDDANADKQTITNALTAINVYNRDNPFLLYTRAGDGDPNASSRVGATVDSERAVFVGAGSSIKMAGDVPANQPTANIVIGKNTYNFAGATMDGIVAVGDMNNTTPTFRKIDGVAAGAISATSAEAINGSQLHAVVEELKKIPAPTPANAVTIAVAKEGDTGVNVSFTQSNPAQTDTLKLTEGKNIELTTTSVGGNHTITIATADDLKANSYTVEGTTVAVNKTGINAGGKVIEGVADGAITADSKQAVNGSQLHSLKEAIQNIPTVANAVLYDNLEKNQVTLGGVAAASPVALTNVADGAITPTSTDAINGSQLFKAKEAIDKRIDGLEEDVNEAKGLAIASAASNIDYVEQRPGEWVAGVGVAHGSKHTAAAIGTSWLSENGNYKFTASYGHSFGGKKAGKAGVVRSSFSFRF